jgi:ABC-type amino acid transport substrate-binding protein
MRRMVVFLGVLAVGFLTLWGDAQACGDKFLVVGRGVRYQRVSPAAHSASILIYMNPASRIPAAAKDAQLESNLKQAGYKVQSVDTSAGLQSALKSSRYDLVLADIADSPGLEKDVSSDPSKPVVVPVLYQPTSAELAAAKKEYGCAMKAPGKDYLATIDDIMARKGKAADAKTGVAK